MRTVDLSQSPLTVTTRSPEETEAVASRLAEELAPGVVVCLTGDLGAGKSVFARALGAALGVEERMPSPTFTIIHEYTGTGDVPILHVDLYRISGEEEFRHLALEDLMGGAVTIVEWPDRAPELLEYARWQVDIQITPGDDQREITLHYHDARTRH